MNQIYRWRLVPAGLPTVLRYCTKCGNESEFACSGNFRVNANQNNIDIWLIYQCQSCNTTWNMEILSRISSGRIDKELYHKCINNDRELAARYAFDTVLHSKNKSTLFYDNMTYDILGDIPELSAVRGEITIEITSDYPVDIRLDRILGRQLGISRESIKRMTKNGSLYAEGIKDISKAKLKTGIMLHIIC